MQAAFEILGTDTKFQTSKQIQRKLNKKSFYYQIWSLKSKKFKTDEDQQTDRQNVCRFIKLQSF